MGKKSLSKPKMASSNVLFCPNPPNIQFILMKEKENHKYSHSGGWNQIIFILSQYYSNYLLVLKIIGNRYNSEQLFD